MANPIYTDEQTRELVAVFQKAEDQDQREAVVRQYAELYNKSTRSIIAKLTREGVYLAKQYRTKQGEQPVSKAELVAELATLFNVPEEKIESLEKANKQVLKFLITWVKEHEAV